jgi:hypothetical protein
MSESGSNQSSGKPVSHTENPSSGKSPSSGSNMSAGFNSTIRQVAGGVPLPYDTSDTELSRETVLEILLNPDHSRLSQLPHSFLNSVVSVSILGYIPSFTHRY